MAALLLLLPSLALALPAADPVGPSLNQAAVGLAGLALAAKIAEDECDDVGVGGEERLYVTYVSIDQWCATMKKHATPWLPDPKTIRKPLNLMLVPNPTIASFD